VWSFLLVHEPPPKELATLLARNRDEALAMLGKDAREIAANRSFGVLLKLVAVCGGQRLEISRLPHRASATRLAGIIGESEAAALIRLFRGDRVNVPTIGRMLSIYRKLRGRDLIARGKTYPEVVRALGLSYSSVEKMGARLRKEAEAARVVR
jgi:hypothetical protein